MTNIKLVIIGGGIVGLAIARQAALSKKFGEIILLEKEDKLGIHASTRNSGVIHAGFYYTPESKKALFCAQGNKLLRQYCVSNKIPLRKCGKVVVTSNESEDKVLENLYERGIKNKCNVQILDSKHLIDYEPYALTNNYFLWSPNTWSASPQMLFQCLINECIEYGVKFKLNTKVVQGFSRNLTTATGEKISFDFLVNAAGGFALDISSRFGNNDQFSLLPFKGLYLKSVAPFSLFTRHIYPVPNLKQPFLGIHTTITHNGFLKLGPTALPAFSPENYSLFEGIELSQLLKIVPLQMYLLASNSFGFRDLALQEIKHILKSQIIQSVSNLISVKLNVEDFKWHSPGIRAQLYNNKSKCLEFDFLLNQNDRTFHLLNSISPAWTCSLKTAEHIVSKVADTI